MPNGIDLILADHRRVEALFATFAETGDGRHHRPGRRCAGRPRRRRARRALPARRSRARRRGGDRAVGAGALRREEADRPPQDAEGAPLVEAFETLRLLVQEHVDDEEKNLLPALADKATDQQLDGLGARILQAKQRGG